VTLNCAWVPWYHPLQRKGYNEQRTFLGVVLVPSRSLLPELVYVLWVGARQV